MLIKLNHQHDKEILNKMLQGASFIFNQWPIITRQHNIFKFEERAFFRIGEPQYSLEDICASHYTYYDFHPQAVKYIKTSLV